MNPPPKAILSPNPPARSPTADPILRDPRQRRSILIAVCLALMAVIASVSGLNVAQPQLALAFAASQGEVLWMINLYTITMAALLLPLGAVGDRWGRKPVLITGLGMFGSAVLVDAASWRCLFILPVVLVLAALPMALRAIPDARQAPGSAFDRVGALTSLSAVVGCILVLHEGPERGWTAPATLLSLLVGVGSATGFVLWERRQQAPLLDVRLFRQRGLANGSVALLAVFGVPTGIFVVLYPYLQAVLGWSGLAATLALMPMPVLTFAHHQRRVLTRYSPPRTRCSASDSGKWLGSMPPKKRILAMGMCTSQTEEPNSQATSGSEVKELRLFSSTRERSPAPSLRMAYSSGSWVPRYRVIQRWPG